MALAAPVVTLLKPMEPSKTKAGWPWMAKPVKHRVFAAKIRGVPGKNNSILGFDMI
jgi:hypothetical protein